MRSFPWWVLHAVCRGTHYNSERGQRPFNSELKSCVKEEVDVLGSPSLTVPAISVDVKKAPLKRKGGPVPQSQANMDLHCII